MVTDVSISYPGWTIILPIIIGLAYSGILYVKNPNNKLGRGLTIFLFLLRFVIVSVLALLLLSPFIKTQKKQIEKPVIAIGIDNSQSIVNSRDSLYYKSVLIDEIYSLRSQLEKSFEVDLYTFGEKVRILDSVAFDDQITNYSGFISSINENYNGINLGAVVLFGDGITNMGTDPDYAASKIVVPVFTVALGDTSKVSDIKIDDVRYNSIVYSGDNFPIEVSLSANDMDNTQSVIRLLENNKVIVSKQVDINSNDFRQTVLFNISAKESGKRRFVVEVLTSANEGAKKNNYRNIFIDVLDSRIKVLIYSDFPHPDIGAIKQSLDNNSNFITEISYTGSPSINVMDYDVIILYQLPSKQVSQNNVLKEIVNNKMPVLYIVGSKSNLIRLKDFSTGITFNSSVNTQARAKFLFNPSFSKFSFYSEFSDQLSSLPPLEVPLTNYNVSGNTDVLGLQEINGFVTDFPMVAYSIINDYRSAMIIGEGIWQWRIYSNLKYNNTTSIDALLSKTIMYLSSELDKRRFKVDSKGDYVSRNDVKLTAELYSEVLEPINSVDVDLVLINEEGEQFSFIFTPFDNYYTLNLNKLKPGKYKYIASVKLSGTDFKYEGEFFVEDRNLENRNLVANHRLLNRISNKTGGKMILPGQLSELKEELSGLKTLKSKIHFQDLFIGINTIIYVLLGLLLLLTIEWFLRKYFGTY